MLLESLIKQVIEAQREILDAKQAELKREQLTSFPNLAAHTLIISGIRRCGKSTLLFQLLTKYKDAVYLNFEDPRLYNFERNDFARLDAVIKATGSKVLFFDELQIIPEWERYVRQKLDEDYKVVVTGSNASLLSHELGTKLTGRHITKELFPFSYTEFCRFLKKDRDVDSVTAYMELGGFPEYLKTSAIEILHHLLEDILIRDIAVRYGIRDVRSLQRLALYLISNTGKPVTGNRLKSLFDIAATSTVMEYLSYLEAAWLFHFVPKFSYSARKQLVNPRKVYAIDTGMITANSTSFSDDNGRKFENLVYLHLRRKYTELYYFQEKRECDFIAFERGSIAEVVQTCYQLTPDNLERELAGLAEALTFFKLESGVIVTLNQRETFDYKGIKIKAVPFHQWAAKK